MFKILQKYNFITVVAFQDTFYHTVPLPIRIKLTKSLVEFNYTRYSPFQNPNILYGIYKKQLSVWFYQTTFKNAFIIPESYLAYRELRKREKDALYIIDDKIIKIIAIKDSLALGMFTLDSMDEDGIKLSMNEYQIKDKKIISQSEYDALIVKSQKTITLKEIFTFSQIELNRKSLLKNFVDKAAYPLVALVLFAMFISYMQGIFIQSNIDELKQKYKIEKMKNSAIKQDIQKHNKEVKKYKSFLEKELAFVDPIILLENIYSIVDKVGGATIYSISVNDENMQLQLETANNPIEYLNKLNESKYFKQIIIQNTKRTKSNKKIITYDIEVKLLKNV